MLAQPPVRRTISRVKPPYEQPGAEIVFWGFFGLFALGEYAMRFRSYLNRKGSARAEGWSLVVVLVTVVGGFVLALRLADSGSAEIRAARWTLFTVGLIAMAAGIVIRQWAIVTLGRFFTADVRVRQDQVVVSRGPYRWVRHPSYTGLLLFFIGLGLALSNWGALLALIALPAIGLFVRIRSEERALEAHLGEPYRQYAATHRRLFPGIW
jgi:protein-S-isoprenylcysteine O-methyltransferase Ste14